LFLRHKLIIIATLFYFIEPDLKMFINKKDKKKHYPVKGFSLLEVLVVLVIIGILVLIALPDQTLVISKARSTEAKIQLQHLFALETAHYFEFGKYSENLPEIGFNQEKLTTDGGNAYYMIKIEVANQNSFIGKATCIVDFDNDGNFNTWQIDENKNLIEIVSE